MADRTPSAAFFTKEGLLADGQNEIHVRVFRGPDWPTPTRIRSNLSDDRGPLKANFSFSPELGEVMSKLMGSTMIMWGRPLDFYNSTFVSYKPLDMTAAMLTLDSCQKEVKEKQAEAPDSELNFDWLIPSKPRQ